MTGSGPTAFVGYMLSLSMDSISQSVSFYSVTYCGCPCSIIASAEAQARQVCMSNAIKIPGYASSSALHELVSNS